MNYFNKIITFQIEWSPFIAFQGKRWFEMINLISSIKAPNLIRKGCIAYLVMIKDLNQLILDLKDVLVVQEFPNMFPKKVLGLPQNREIKFTIDLALGIKPISTPLYIMALVKLKELKTQL